MNLPTSPHLSSFLSLFAFFLFRYLSRCTQGGKKLREHRFLAYLEGKYSDNVKL